VCPTRYLMSSRTRGSSRGPREVRSDHRRASPCVRSANRTPCVAGRTSAAEPALRPGGVRAGQRAGRGHGHCPGPGAPQRRGDGGFPRPG
jgi:hypothetical protein